MNADSATPFVRWAGSKRKLLKEILPRLPDDIGKRRYVEPFLGGGAVFFALAPKRALLNDLNADLINTYQALQEQDSSVLDILWPMLKHHDALLYHLVRDLYNARSEEADGLLRAAWFLYLMATCFNGLYRVNASGEFNTPIGDRVNFVHNRIDDAVRVLRAGALRRDKCEIKLQSADFATIEHEPADFWFLDPPYAPASPTASFVSYTPGGFGDADQCRLRAFTERLTWLGARWMQTNSDVPRIRELYQGCRIEQIMAPRTMAANGDRTDAAELIIRNY